MSTENTNDRSKVVIPGYIESNDGGYVVDASKVGYNGNTTIDSAVREVSEKVSQLETDINATSALKYIEKDGNGTNSPTGWTFISIPDFLKKETSKIIFCKIGIGGSLSLPFYIAGKESKHTVTIQKYEPTSGSWELVTEGVDFANTNSIIQAIKNVQQYGDFYYRIQVSSSNGNLAKSNYSIEGCTTQALYYMVTLGSETVTINKIIEENASKRLYSYSNGQTDGDDIIGNGQTLTIKSTSPAQGYRYVFYGMDIKDTTNINGTISSATTISFDNETQTYSIGNLKFKGSLISESPVKSGLSVTHNMTSGLKINDLLTINNVNSPAQNTIVETNLFIFTMCLPEKIGSTPLNIISDNISNIIIQPVNIAGKDSIMCVFDKNLNSDDNSIYISSDLTTISFKCITNIQSLLAIGSLSVDVYSYLYSESHPEGASGIEEYNRGYIKALPNQPHHRNISASPGQSIQVSFADSLQDSFFEDTNTEYSYFKVSNSTAYDYKMLQKIIIRGANGVVYTYYSNIAKCRIYEIFSQYSNDAEDYLKFNFSAPGIGVGKETDSNIFSYDASTKTTYIGGVESGPVIGITNVSNTSPSNRAFILQDIADISHVKTDSEEKFRTALSLKKGDVVKLYDNSKKELFNIGASLFPILPSNNPPYLGEMSFELFIKTHDSTEPFKDIVNISIRGIKISFTKNTATFSVPTAKKTLQVDIEPDAFTHLVFAIRYTFDKDTSDKDTAKISGTESKHRTIEIFVNGILSACAEFDSTFVKTIQDTGKVPTIDDVLNSSDRTNYLRTVGSSDSADDDCFLINSDIDGASSNSEIDIQTLRIYARALPRDKIYKNYRSCLSISEYDAYDNLKKNSLMEIIFIKHAENSDHHIMCKHDNDDKNTMSIISGINSIKDKAVSKKSLSSTLMLCKFKKDAEEIVLCYPDCDLYLQGTSSLVYPVKNYKIKLFNSQGITVTKIETNTYEVSDKRSKAKILPPSIDQNGESYWNKNSKDNVYTLKCDYMEQSHRNNTPTAEFYHDLLLPSICNVEGENSSEFSPARRAIDADNKHLYRDSIAGIPCVVYAIDNYADLNNLYVNNRIDTSTTISSGEFNTIKDNAIYMGSYMFNVDKEGTALGFDIPITNLPVDDAEREDINNSNKALITKAFNLDDGDSRITSIGTTGGNIDKEYITISKDSNDNIVYSISKTNSDNHISFTGLKSFPAVSFEGGTNDNYSAATFIPIEFAYERYVWNLWQESYVNSNGKKGFILMRPDMIGITASSGNKFLNFKEQQNNISLYNSLYGDNNPFDNNNPLDDKNQLELQKHLKFHNTSGDDKTFFVKRLTEGSSTKLQDINNEICRSGAYNIIGLEKLYDANSGFDEFYKDFIEVSLSFPKYSDTNSKIDYDATDDTGKYFYSRDLIVIFMDQNGSYSNNTAYYKSIETFEKRFREYYKDGITNEIELNDEELGSSSRNIDVYRNAIKNSLITTTNIEGINYHTPESIYNIVRYMIKSLETRYNYFNEKLEKRYNYVTKKEEDGDDYDVGDILEKLDKQTGLTDTTIEYLNKLSILYEYSYKSLYDIICWVYNSSDADFERDFEKHFSKKYCLAYYLQMISLAQIDNAGKNAMFDTWGDGIYYPRPYDMDSQMGLANDGTDAIPSYVELNSSFSPQRLVTNNGTTSVLFGQRTEIYNGWQTKSSEKHIRFNKYNTKYSILWNKFARVFKNDIRTYYYYLRGSGCAYDIDTMMRFIDQKTADLIHPDYYNNDAINKYLSTEEGFVYVYCVSGNRRIRYKRFLSERLYFLDSYFNVMEDLGFTECHKMTSLGLRSGTSTTFNLDIAVNNPAYIRIVVDVGKQADFVVLLLPEDRIALSNGATKRGSSIQLKIDASDKNIEIYGAGYINTLDNINIMMPTSARLSNCSDLLTLSLKGSANLEEFQIGYCKYLRELDLSDCYNLSDSLSLQRSGMIERVILKNTAITGLSLAENSAISYLDISKDNTYQGDVSKNIKSLTISGSNISEENIITNESQLEAISFERCPNIKDFNFDKFKSSLKYLTLNECDNIVSLSLRQFNEIRELNIQHCSNIFSINLYKSKIKPINNDLTLDFSTLKNLRYLNCIGVRNMGSYKLGLKIPTATLGEGEKRLKTRKEMLEAYPISIVDTGKSIVDGLILRLSIEDISSYPYTDIDYVYTEKTDVSETGDTSSSKIVENNIYDFTGVNLAALCLYNNNRVKNIYNLTYHAHCSQSDNDNYTFIQPESSSSNNYKLFSAYLSGSTGSNSLSYMFFGNRNLENFKNCKITYDSNESLVSMERMFSGCISLTNIPEEITDVHEYGENYVNGHVFKVEAMFQNCIAMVHTHNGAYAHHGLDFIGKKNNFKRLRYLSNLFYDALYVENKDALINPLDIDDDAFLTNITDNGEESEIALGYSFGAGNILGRFNARLPSKTRNTSFMFHHASALKEINSDIFSELTNSNVKLTGMFNGCGNLLTIPNVRDSNGNSYMTNVVDISQMFRNCHSLGKRKTNTDDVYTVEISDSFTIKVGNSVSNYQDMSLVGDNENVKFYISNMGMLDNEYIVAIPDPDNAEMEILLIHSEKSITEIVEAKEITDAIVIQKDVVTPETRTEYVSAESYRTYKVYKTAFYKKRNFKKYIGAFTKLKTAIQTFLNVEYFAENFYFPNKPFSGLTELIHIDGMFARSKDRLETASRNFDIRPSDKIYLPQQLFNGNSKLTSINSLFANRYELLGMIKTPCLNDIYVTNNRASTTYCEKTNYVSADIFKGAEKLHNLGATLYSAAGSMPYYQSSRPDSLVNLTTAIPLTTQLSGVFSNTNIRAVSDKIFHGIENGDKKKLDISLMFFMGDFLGSSTSCTPYFNFTGNYAEPKDLLQSRIIFVDDSSSSYVSASNVKNVTNIVDSEFDTKLDELNKNDTISIDSDIALELSRNLILSNMFYTTNNTSYESMKLLFCGQSDLIWSIEADQSDYTDYAKYINDGEFKHIFSGISVKDISGMFLRNQIYVIPDNIFKGQSYLENIQEIFTNQFALTLLDASLFTSNSNNKVSIEKNYLSVATITVLDGETPYRDDDQYITTHTGIAEDIFDGCTALTNCQGAFMGSSVSLRVVKLENNVYDAYLSNKIFESCRGSLKYTNHMFALCNNMVGRLKTGRIDVDTHAKYLEYLKSKISSAIRNIKTTKYSRKYYDDKNVERTESLPIQSITYLSADDASVYTEHLTAINDALTKYLLDDGNNYGESDALTTLVQAVNIIISNAGSTSYSLSEYLTDTELSSNTITTNSPVEMVKWLVGDNSINDILHLAYCRLNNNIINRYFEAYNEFEKESGDTASPIINFKNLYSYVLADNRYEIPIDKSDIKELGLLSDCTSLVSTAFMFSQSTRLYGSIPADIFSTTDNKKYQNLKYITGMFSGCNQLTMFKPDIVTRAGVTTQENILSLRSGENCWRCEFGNFKKIYPINEIFNLETTTITYSGYESIQLKFTLLPNQSAVEEDESAFNYHWLINKSENGLYGISNHSGYTIKYSYKPLKKNDGENGTLNERMYFIPDDWADNLTEIVDISYLFCEVGAPATWSYEKEYVYSDVIGLLPATIPMGAYKPIVRYGYNGTDDVYYYISIGITAFDNPSPEELASEEYDKIKYNIETVNWKLGRNKMTSLVFSKSNKITSAAYAFSNTISLIDCDINDDFLYASRNKIQDIRGIFSFSNISSMSGFMSQGSTSLKYTTAAFAFIRYTLYPSSNYYDELILDDGYLLDKREYLFQSGISLLNSNMLQRIPMFSQDISEFTEKFYVEHTDVLSNLRYTKFNNISTTDTAATANMYQGTFTHTLKDTDKGIIDNNISETLKGYIIGNVDTDDVDFAQIKPFYIPYLANDAIILEQNSTRYLRINNTKKSDNRRGLLTFENYRQFFTLRSNNASYYMRYL